MKMKSIAEFLTISLCDENHLKHVAYKTMMTLMIMMSRAKYQIIIWDFVHWDLFLAAITLIAVSFTNSSEIKLEAGW